VWGYQTWEIMNKNEQKTQEGKEMWQERTDWTDLLTFDVIISRLIHTKEEHEYIKWFGSEIISINFHIPDEINFIDWFWVI
jgi:hypothetical protein